VSCQLVSPSVTHATDKLTCQCRPLVPRIRREGTDLESRKKKILCGRSPGSFARRKLQVSAYGQRDVADRSRNGGIGWDPWSLHDPVRFPWSDYV